MPGMPCKVLAGVLRLADLGHPHRHAAADLDVLELILACGQSLVERVGMVGAPAVVDPVAALDELRLYRDSTVAGVGCLYRTDDIILPAQEILVSLYDLSCLPRGAGDLPLGSRKGMGIKAGQERRLLKHLAYRLLCLIEDLNSRNDRVARGGKKSRSLLVRITHDDPVTIDRAALIQYHCRLL